MDAAQKRPLKLDDLDKLELKASDAFLAMGKFLRAYFDRTKGEGDLATICSDVEVEDDQMSTDPAALSDWQECVAAVLAGDGRARPPAL
jgi:hypothetical protein